MQELRRGYKALVEDCDSATVEFVPTGGYGGNEVLIRVASAPSPLRWVAQKKLSVTHTEEEHTERGDVREYKDKLQGLALWREGCTVAKVANILQRREPWVDRLLCMYKDADKVTKPKNMEHWDSRGFCDVVYVRQYARRRDLFNTIVQQVEWEQDHVWRVHKNSGGGEGTWHLRTVKECAKCHSALSRVPDNTTQLGPRSAAKQRRPPQKPHQKWVCAENCPGCEKPGLGAVCLNHYMVCQRCQWYACGRCAAQMPDRATSKQAPSNIAAPRACVSHPACPTCYRHTEAHVYT